MWVIGQMEFALDHCQEGCTASNCTSEAALLWDEAVAYYSGSLVGTSGLGAGVLLYTQADKRCANFATCGAGLNELTGISAVNSEIMPLFQQGQQQLLAGQCVATIATKERIVQLMTVPLVQGVLRYAYTLSAGTDTGEGPQAEGGTIAAGLLPMVYACDKNDAATVYENMKLGGTQVPDFAAVKGALERQYSCLGITCEDVGGLYDTQNQGYFNGAEPCGSKGARSRTNANGVNVGLAVGLSIGGLVTVLLIVFASSYLGPKAAPPPVTEVKSEVQELS